ncbi:hypothetical protein OOK41_00100 [Micromonospora sp. NBC_01655]|uniref:hypothetical protein n=1 Tax=Micromonospora sp. NBC_01655 TaxID=2975983 RepID=UPI0022540AAD|nr:hypothetical protein [Micromonospora sp. NBC_01655]MCX4468732.1 hypothetical protein [Micromonospora sp. NBC_01655]
MRHTSSGVSSTGFARVLAPSPDVGGSYSSPTTRASTANGSSEWEPITRVTQSGRSRVNRRPGPRAARPNRPTSSHHVEYELPAYVASTSIHASRFASVPVGHGRRSNANSGES